MIKKVEEKIFREYDLRGIYPSEIDKDTAYTIGKSFGTYIKKMGENETIIGHDNRLSSPELSTYLLQGLLDSGMNVINLGLVTTPMYYYGKKKFNCTTGIMVTASHNPKEYNGFKIAFTKTGNAYGKLITDFRDFTNNLEFDDGNGIERKVNIKKEYVSKMISLINDSDKRINMGRQGRINSETYSSKYFAERVLQVYKIALKGRPLKNNKTFISRLKNTIKRGFHGK
jgi:phosphomannomutase/phosphoglucomutase